jgi:predicted nicotinamide N-methyase
VLDLGCGLGPCGFAAARQGAQVTFLDWEPRALEIVQASAAEQGLPPETFDFVLADWRKPPRLEPFDLILAADVLYERRNAPGVATFVGRHLKAGGEAWVVDPGRPYVEDLPIRTRVHGLELVRTEILAEQPKGAITLLRLRRPRWGRSQRVRGRTSGRHFPGVGS